MNLVDRITELITPVADEQGLELVRVRWLSGRVPVLQIMAENSAGVMTVDMCASFSRAISALLDVEDPISDEYTLEVSSPGIDRPLTRPKDFVNWADQEAKIELSRPIDGRKRFRGVLKGMDGDIVLLELPDLPESAEIGLARLPFADIQDAKLVLTDALVALAAPQLSPDETNTLPTEDLDGGQSHGR